MAPFFSTATVSDRIHSGLFDDISCFEYKTAVNVVVTPDADTEFTRAGTSSVYKTRTVRVTPIQPRQRTPTSTSDKSVYDFAELRLNDADIFADFSWTSSLAPPSTVQEPSPAIEPSLQEPNATSSILSGALPTRRPKSRGSTIGTASSTKRHSASFGHDNYAPWDVEDDDWAEFCATGCKFTGSTVLDDCSKQGARLQDTPVQLFTSKRHSVAPAPIPMLRKSSDKQMSRRSSERAPSRGTGVLRAKRSSGSVVPTPDAEPVDGERDEAEPVHAAPSGHKPSAMDALIMGAATTKLPTIAPVGKQGPKSHTDTAPPVPDVSTKPSLFTNLINSVAGAVAVPQSSQKPPRRAGGSKASTKRGTVHPSDSISDTLDSNPVFVLDAPENNLPTGVYAGVRKAQRPFSPDLDPWLPGSTASLFQPLDESPRRANTVSVAQRKGRVSQYL